MQKVTTPWVELAKYPILVFSLLLAIILAKTFLGLEFGLVTEVSTQGVKFAQQSQATVEALAEIEGKLNEHLVRIEALVKQRH